MKELRITVRDLAGVDRLRPLSGGVPIAEGAAPRGATFVLHDELRNAVPLQSSVLARWRDGSSRWVLLDFQSRPAPFGELGYVLSWGDDARKVEPDTPVSAHAGAEPLMQTGDLTVTRHEGALLSLSGRFDLVLSLADSGGKPCRAVVEETQLETEGKLRSTLLLRGCFRTAAGGRVFQFRLRVSIFAGLSAIRIEPLILVDSDVGIIQKIRELKLTLVPRRSAPCRIGGSPGWSGSTDSKVRLFQSDDARYVIQGEGGEGGEASGGKAPGWAELGDGQGTVALALRDFWQQWPKSVEVSPEGLAVGLFPRFEEGDFAHLEPWYKHQYLFEGSCYRLRTGQARRWEIWVDLGGHGESLARMGDAPLVPAADAAQAVATGVWDAIAPAGADGMAAYDSWAENLFRAYCQAIEVDRDYGAMNWGDWFGERQVNWGNHEYDTANQILIQFARTGDPRYLYVADAASRHSIEVDTIHHVNADLAKYFTDNWPTKGFTPRAGMVHEHTVGHVSGFYSIETIRALFVEHDIGEGNKNPYLCMDPFNLGHIWTQGSARHYFLTGDPFTRETVVRIADNLAQLVEDGVYDFGIDDAHSGRGIGWPLLALAGAYEIDLDERYLRAMRNLTERMLRRQDPVCGGWLYSLYPGHCFCTTHKHVGMAGFITSILVNGLSRYQLLAGHEALPQAIDRAVTFLNNDTWREEWQDWRYTSCPASAKMGQPGVTVMALVNAVRIARNPEHLRILKVAWEAKFERLRAAPKPGPGQGKSYSATMYGCAEAAGLLATTGPRDRPTEGP